MQFIVEICNYKNLMSYCEYLLTKRTYNVVTLEDTIKEMERVRKAYIYYLEHKESIVEVQIQVD
jgi:hypothetical protein